jgi:Bacterial pre-peptidase C-terminal domain
VKTEGLDSVRMCIDKFLPDDRVSAAEARAVSERPDNRMVIPLGGPRLIGRPRMALLTQTLWKPATKLHVRFLDGDAAVRTKVEEVAHQWETYANIGLVFDDARDAEIRISFRQEGSWSHLGTLAREIPPTNPTMNYGWLTPESETEEYSRVVLHEFGHALGCIHEHQSPGARIPWNKPRVYAYYAHMGWSSSQVDDNLFLAYSPEAITNSRYDRDSIMQYPVDNQLTVGDWEVGWNRALSDQDKAFIAGQYPFQEKETVPVTPDGTPAAAEIGSHGEIDRFQFAVASPARYTIQTLGPTDVSMALYGPDSESSLLEADDDSGSGLNARIESELRPGGYVIEVRHFRPTGSGAYQLVVAPSVA